MNDIERGPEPAPEANGELVRDYVMGYVDPTVRWTEDSIQQDLFERWNSGDLSMQQVSEIATRLGLDLSKL